MSTDAEMREHFKQLADADVANRRAERANPKEKKEMVETQALARNGEAEMPSGTPFEQDTIRLAKAMAQSGFFKDSSNVAQAVVKILAGRELGFGPVASMTGVYIVDGKVTLSANLMAAAVKRSGRYNYRVRELTNTTCQIEFFEGKESIGVSGFTIEDATAANLAGKDTWRKYPRNLLFARAMSNGVRFHCADVVGGPTYTPEELGASVDEDGTPMEFAPQAELRRGVVPEEGEYREQQTVTFPAFNANEPPKPRVYAEPPAVMTGEDIPDDQAEEVAALFDQESPLRQECRALHAKMVAYPTFALVPLPGDDEPSTVWNSFLDGWTAKLDQHERAIERRGAVSQTKAR